MNFKIVDHGIEHEQFFQGAGTAFTKWTACVTGIGNSAKEAADDALDQVYSSMESPPKATIAQIEEEVGKMEDEPDRCNACEDPPGDRPCGECCLYHYVTIYWR